jgi:hypothetical protein
MRREVVAASKPDSVKNDSGPIHMLQIVLGRANPGG